MVCRIFGQAGGLGPWPAAGIGRLYSSSAFIYRFPTAWRLRPTCLSRSAWHLSVRCCSATLMGFTALAPFFCSFYVRIFAARAYRVLFTGCRGSFDSGGEFSAGTHEAADGRGHGVLDAQAAVVYGIVCLPLAPPTSAMYNGPCSPTLPDMKAAVIFTGPHDLESARLGEWRLSFGYDCLRLNSFRDPAPPPLLSIAWWLKGQPSRLRPAYDSVPPTPSWYRQAF